MTKKDPVVKAWIKEKLATGVVQKVPRAMAKAIMPVFALPKPDSGHRIIFDMRRLNRFLRAPKFKLEGIKNLAKIIQPNDLMIKVDISEAFYHLIVAKADRPYTCFQYGKQIYSHVGMPMGSACSPYLFQKVTRPMVEEWRRRGIRLISYVDDFILLAQPDMIELHKEIVLQDLKDLGWKINEKKSNLTPQKTQNFLGFVVSTKNTEPELLMTKPKVKKTCHEIRRFAKRTSTTVRQAMRIIGTAISATLVVPEAEVLVRSLLRRINPVNDWETVVSLTENIRQDLLLLAKSISASPRRVLNPLPTIEITTDASSTGFGMALSKKGQVLATFQEVRYQDEHINYAELKAVLRALIKFEPLLGENRVVRLKLDNFCAMRYAERGTGRAVRLAALARKVFFFCKEKRITLLPEFIPGVENTLADFLSRVQGFEVKRESLQRAGLIEGRYLFPTLHPSPTLKAIETAKLHSLPLITPLWTAAVWFPILIVQAVKAKRIPATVTNLYQEKRVLKRGLVVWQLTSKTVSKSQAVIDKFCTQIETSEYWANVSKNS